MADLRALFEGLGFRHVRTLLNSGNVVFSAPPRVRADAVRRIQKALASKLQLTTPVTVLSADEVAAAVRDNPFSHVATNPSRLLVVVPTVPSGLRRLRPLLKQRCAPEAFALGSRVAYLWCAGGVARSPLWTAVDHALERLGTARNMATMTKLIAAAVSWTMGTEYELKAGNIVDLLRAASLRHRKQIGTLLKVAIRRKGEGFRYFDQSGAKISLADIHRRSQADPETQRSIYNLWFLYTM